MILLIVKPGFADRPQYEQDGGGGLEKRHPMAAIAADLERQLLFLEQHFGLTPASRQRLSLDPCQQSERRDAMEDRRIFQG